MPSGPKRRSPRLRLEAPAGEAPHDLAEQVVVVGGVDHHLADGSDARDVPEEREPLVKSRVLTLRARRQLETGLRLRVACSQHGRVGVPRVAAGVGEQVVDEDVVGAVAGDLGQVVLRRAIQPEEPILDELQHQRRGDRLGDGHDREERVGLERRGAFLRTEDAPGLVQDDHPAPRDADAQGRRVTVLDPTRAQVAGVAPRARAACRPLRESLVAASSSCVFTSRAIGSASKRRAQLRVGDARGHLVDERARRARSSRAPAASPLASRARARVARMRHVRVRKPAASASCTAPVCARSSSSSQRSESAPVRAARARGPRCARAAGPGARSVLRRLLGDGSAPARHRRGRAPPRPRPAARHESPVSSLFFATHAASSAPAAPRRAAITVSRSHHARAASRCATAARPLPTPAWPRPRHGPSAPIASSQTATPSSRMQRPKGCCSSATSSWNDAHASSKRPRSVSARPLMLGYCTGGEPSCAASAMPVVARGHALLELAAPEVVPHEPEQVLLQAHGSRRASRRWRMRSASAWASSERHEPEPCRRPPRSAAPRRRAPRRGHAPPRCWRSPGRGTPASSRRTSSSG